MASAIGGPGLHLPNVENYILTMDAMDDNENVVDQLGSASDAHHSLFSVLNHNHILYNLASVIQLYEIVSIKYKIRA